MPRHFSPSSISIKHRLPLLIGILLLAIITASTWSSYRRVKEAAVAAGSERLQNLTKQLANISQQSSNTLLARTSAVANEPAIRSLLQDPSPERRGPAAAVLEQFSTTHDPSNLQVELWDANRNLLLTEPAGVSAQPYDIATELTQLSQAPFRVAGALRIMGDSVISPSVAAVKNDAGTTVGYLVRWRRVTASPPPQQLRDLLGSEATLYFGNTSGEVWTDLSKVAPPTSS